ncbi:MAG TPA: hypothetical protein VIJ95_14645 [Hanamia sp.]
MILKCKIVDFFETSIEDIYFIEFSDLEYVPNFNLRFKYLNNIFKITSLSVGNHEYYNSLGKLYKNKVWSCGLRIMGESQNIHIPIGTEVDVLE